MAGDRKSTAEAEIEILNRGLGSYALPWEVSVNEDRFSKGEGVLINLTMIGPATKSLPMLRAGDVKV
jgi:hypothetical protein